MAARAADVRPSGSARSRRRARGPVLRGGDGEPDGEGGAAADLALDGDVAAERAGEGAADGEPDARATALPRLAAPELLEDRPLLLPGDARAVVRDGDGDPAPFRRCRPALARLDANDDPPVLGRVLDRVGEQVAEDLADPPLVALDHGDGIGQPR